MIEEYEGDDELESDSRADHHHEDTAAFKDRFSKDVNNLDNAMVSNPFKLEKLTVLNQEDASFNDSVFEDLKVMCAEGEKQFLQFWNKRLASSEVSIKEPISLNSFNLPGNQNKRATKDPVMTTKMIDKVKDTAKIRRSAVENALNTEVFGIAQSLAKDQFSLYHGTKSHVVNPFSIASIQTVFPYSKFSIVVELSMFFRKKRPTWVISFSDFAKFLYGDIMDLSKQFHRCDVIINRYFVGV
jgi:hypothetical protein